MNFNTIPEALQDLKQGKIILGVGRKNKKSYCINKCKKYWLCWA